MNPLVASFINDVAALAPSLRQALQEIIDYWAPDEAPPIVALGDLGAHFAKDFKSIDTATTEALFQAIENALAVGDADLSTAVATGMIEAIIHKSMRMGTWDEIRPMLGELSVLYADAWIAS